MKQTDYAIGDIVRLKSGGPDMTVIEPNMLCGITDVNCRWFDNNGEWHKEQFHPDELVAVEGAKQ
jgi:uncharacterized protein YodC (DUF2158 family)